jgi:hypothetical protein
MPSQEPNLCTFVTEQVSQMKVPDTSADDLLLVFISKALMESKVISRPCSTHVKEIHDSSGQWRTNEWRWGVYSSMEERQQGHAWVSYPVISQGRNVLLIISSFTAVYCSSMRVLQCIAHQLVYCSVLLISSCTEVHSPCQPRCTPYTWSWLHVAAWHA